MSIYKRGKFYWHKFMWSGEQVRESHQTEQRQGCSPNYVSRQSEAGPYSAAYIKLTLTLDQSNHDVLCVYPCWSVCCVARLPHSIFNVRNRTMRFAKQSYTSSLACRPTPSAASISR
jgi:hypothetical protein